MKKPATPRPLFRPSPPIALTRILFCCVGASFADRAACLLKPAVLRAVGGEAWPFTHVSFATLQPIEIKV
jgi:hypothetical protein